MGLGAWSMETSRCLRAATAQASHCARLAQSAGSLGPSPLGPLQSLSAAAPRVSVAPARGVIGVRDAPPTGPSSNSTSVFATASSSHSSPHASLQASRLLPHLVPPAAGLRTSWQPDPDGAPPPLLRSDPTLAPLPFQGWPHIWRPQPWRLLQEPRHHHHHHHYHYHHHRQRQPAWQFSTGRHRALAAAAASAAAESSTPAEPTPASSASAAAPPPALLLVHPRHRGVEDREEALRLAESLIGGPCPFLEVGGSKLRPRRHSSGSGSSRSGGSGRPVVSGLRSTYFGSGTMVELARRLDALDASAESESGIEALHSGSSAVPQWQQPEEDWAAEVAADEVVEAQRGAGSGARGGIGGTGGTGAGSGSGSGGGGGGGAAPQGGGSRQGGGPRAPALINEVLTPLQERNIEAGLDRPVVDRVGLILRLFAQRAHTREARLQVELASLSYMLPRLVRMRGADGRRGAFGVGLGWGGLSPELGPAPQVVSARQRGSTGAGGLGGGGGSGDPELRQQRFRIKQRLATLRAALRAVAASRWVQRQGRRAAGLPTVAIVGYTNVGKTSLASAMASGDADLPPPSDLLFATLDPAVRRVWLPTRGSHVAVSDTVGFIRDLPVGLVAAFRATLEEVVAADLLLHVLDASSPNVAQQRDAVLAVLRQLGVSEHVLACRTIEVWNKVDLLGRGGRDAATAVRQPLSYGAAALAGAPGRGGARAGGGAICGADAGTVRAAPVGPWDEQEDEDEDVEEEGVGESEEGEEEEHGEEVADDIDDGALTESGSGGGGGGGFPAQRQEQRGNGARWEPMPTPGLHGELVQARARKGQERDSLGRTADVSSAVGWEDDGPGDGNDSSGSNDAMDGTDAGPVPPAHVAVPPPAPPHLRRPARRLFGDSHVPDTSQADDQTPRPCPPPQPQPQPNPEHTHPAPQPPPSPPTTTRRSGSPSDMRRTLHSASRAGFHTEYDVGRSSTAEHKSGRGWDAEGAGAASVKGEEAKEDGGGGRDQEDPRQDGGWADGACLAAAADLVRQVHAAGGSPPAAVVLAAVAKGGGGVAEVKAAVDAVLRTAALRPPLTAARAAGGGVSSKTARGSAAAAVAGDRGGGAEATAEAATSAEAAGKWVSPLLWLADRIPWPLPPQSQDAPSRCWHAAAGADAAGMVAGDSDGGAAGEASEEPGSATAAAARPARRRKGQRAMSEQEYGASPPPSPSRYSKAGKRRWEPSPSSTAVTGTAAPPAEVKAMPSTPAEAPPDGEELEELIRFLRRRRPRGKADE